MLLQLEELLQREVSGVDVEVLNLGIGGWTSAEAVAAFAMVGLSFSPDLVVVHCVNNDMEPMRAMQPKVDYSHYRRAMNVVQTEAGAARFRQDAGDIVDAVIAKWSKLYVYAKLFQSGQVPPRASLHALTTWNNDTQPEPGAREPRLAQRRNRVDREPQVADQVLRHHLAAAAPGVAAPLPAAADQHGTVVELLERELATGDAED